MSPKNVSLKVKLLGGFLVISSIVLLISFVSISASNKIVELFEEILHNDVPRYTTLLEIKNTTNDISKETQLLAVKQANALVDNQDYNTEKNAILAKVEELHNEIDFYEGHIETRDGVKVQALKQILDSTDTIVDNAFQLLSLREQHATQAAVTAIEKELIVNQQVLQTQIGNIIDEELKHIEQEDTEAEQISSQMISNVIIIAVMAVILAISGGFFLSIPIVARVRKLRNAAFEVAKGNLDTAVTSTSSDEIGQLAQSFNEMTHKLKQQYQQLKEENAKDEILLQSIGDGMIVIDSTAKILKINDIGKQILMITQEVTGKEISDAYTLYNLDGDPVSKQQIPAYIALESRKQISEIFTIKREGKNHLVSISANPVIQDTRLIGVIMIIRDVTKEREIDRMKTEFISLASHQLRTPLSAIKWFSEMLLGGDAGELTPEQKDFAKNITESTERMIQLVNSLLNISRIESGRIVVDPRPTDLKELVQGVVTDLKGKTEQKKQTLLISVHDDLPKINLDPRLIRQVYMNLLTNAIKYTPQGGEITVFISKKDDYIISQVSDNGYGIPKSQHDKVFNKFFRAENIVKVETDGTGLGLYLIKAIVESSKGKIWFESEEGKGTSFWFSLPVSGMEAKKGEVSLD